MQNPNPISVLVDFTAIEILIKNEASLFNVILVIVASSHV